MRILIVSATYLEIKSVVPLLIKQGVVVNFNLLDKHVTDFLITGIGTVQTTLHLSKYVNSYDLIINVGLAGSYRKEISVGQVVSVSHDAFGDYGIDDNGSFIPLANASFVDANEKFFFQALPNRYYNKFTLQHIKTAKGITLNTVTGSFTAIERNVKIWNPDIETMESAAVFYVCSSMHCPFICLRAISNYVEPRSRDSWNIPLALKTLSEVLTSTLNVLS